MEEQSVGTIGTDTYMFFIRACSLKYVIIGMVSLWLYGLLLLAADLWLSAWSEDSITNVDVSIVDAKNVAKGISLAIFRPFTIMKY